MANVLSEEKSEQVVALGLLGWSLRRIDQSTGVRRETASAYLRPQRSLEIRPTHSFPFKRKALRWPEDACDWADRFGRMRSDGRIASDH